MATRKNHPLPVWTKAFLSCYAETGNVSVAAKSAGVARLTVYSLAHRNERFRELKDSAAEAAADALELEARRRALDGVKEPVYYRGQVVGHVQKYSDILLMFLLKGLRPQKYREGKVYVNTSGETNPSTIAAQLRQAARDMGLTVPAAKKGTDAKGEGEGKEQ